MLLLPRSLFELCYARLSATASPQISLVDRSRLFCTSYAALNRAGARGAHTGDAHAYSSTLSLPKTAFPLRADAVKREPLFRSVTTDQLYRWQESQSERPYWVLHDGPPYANGHLHAGHALNKILKDIINRSKLLQGCRVNYIPGYDTHGLPLELKALATLKKPASTLTPQQIRAAARKEAEEGIALQASEFAEFACMASLDSKDAYKTLNWSYERRQLNVVRDMVAKGLIISRNRPTIYSPSSQTALAEAELEYREDHPSRSVYVMFELANVPKELEGAVEDGAKIHLLIWTTTPWTLPSNMAVAVSSDLEYSLVRDDRGRLSIIASERLEALSALFDTTLTSLTTLSGTQLSSATYRSPLAEKVKPVICGDHVTAATGTGLVHTAPAHGVEDWEAWRAHRPNDQVACAVDSLGRFDSNLTSFVPASIADSLVGRAVLTDGNARVIEMLQERDALLKEVPITHKYPYDWRTKKPVIYRASQQWFANLDRIKQEAVAALDGVKFVPERGRTTLQMYVEGRSEWCISRQRAWGVPIPVVYSLSTDGKNEEPVLTPSNIAHIIDVLDRNGGTDYWWQGEPEEFVEPSLLARSTEEGRTWRKGTDTLDVWFDSGCSWTLLRELGLRSADQPFADLYLEGSDQHRGWFQSSLLTAISSASGDAQSRAPYRSVLTHGMVLDEQGRKMSKSLGNVVSPLSVIYGGKDKKKEPAYGVDLLRLWVASVDSTRDVAIGPGILAQTSESLRKMRNTARFMLGNTAAEGGIATSTPPAYRLIDRFILHETYQLDRICREAYNDFAFNKVYQALTSFSTSTLSAFYFDVVKDSLYADSLSCKRRRAVTSVLKEVLKVYTLALAPIAPHLAEEIHYFASQRSSGDPSGPGADRRSSVFEQVWQAAVCPHFSFPVLRGFTIDPQPDSWRDARASEDTHDLLVVRTAVTGMLEGLRNARLVGSSTEAQVWLESNSSLLKQYAPELAELFGVSRVVLTSDSSEATIPDTLRFIADTPSDTPQTSRTVEVRGEKVNTTVTRSEGLKCPRCWLHTREKESDKTCKRCEEVLRAHTGGKT